MIRDNRDAEQIGLTIKQYRQSGLDALAAADLACPTLATSESAAQALVRNEFRPQGNGSPSPETPHREGQ